MSFNGSVNTDQTVIIIDDVEEPRGVSGGLLNEEPENSEQPRRDDSKVVPTHAASTANSPDVLAHQAKTPGKNTNAPPDSTSASLSASIQSSEQTSYTWLKQLTHTSSAQAVRTEQSRHDESTAVHTHAISMGTSPDLIEDQVANSNALNDSSTIRVLETPVQTSSIKLKQEAIGSPAHALASLQSTPSPIAPPSTPVESPNSKGTQYPPTVQYSPETQISTSARNETTEGDDTKCSFMKVLAVCLLTGIVVLVIYLSVRYV